MVRSITLGLVAFGTAATLAAQAPAPPTPSPERQAPPSVDQPAPRTQTQAPMPPSASASSANKVTYSGCLKPGATPGTWVLESAALSTGGAASADRPVGTSGASESFLLTAKPTDNLKPHANHKIEVTGVVGAASMTSSTTSTTTTTSPAPGAPTESKTSSSTASTTSTPRQAITIDSFKMVSASCP